MPMMRGRTGLGARFTVGLAGLAVSLAVTGLGGVACSPSTGITKGSNDVSSKPDLPDLGDGMLIGESDFPAGDGKFKTVAVDTRADEPNVKDDCDQRGWVRKGDKKGMAGFTGGPGPAYRVSLAHTKRKVDVAHWASLCLPHTEKHTVMRSLDVPELPPGAVAIEIAEDAHPDDDEYVAIGYVRGILVVAEVGAGKDGMSKDAKADLAKIFNAQTEHLNSY